MKRLVAILAFAAAAWMAAAQTPDTTGGITAYTQACKAYAKSPQAVDALYGMALLHMDSAGVMQSLPTAMDFILKAEEGHLKLLEANTYKEIARLARKGVTIYTIRDTRDAIVDAARREIARHTDMDYRELTAYLEAFSFDEGMVRVLRQRRIRMVYEDDLAAGTADSYYHFITAYPGTAEADRMEELLAKLAPGLFEGINDEDAIDAVAERYAMSPSVRRAAAKQKSRTAYAEAMRSNTIPAIKDFLRRYPTSDENQQARDQLEALLAVQYGTLRTARQYADFADSNADNVLADQAILQIRRMIEDKHDVEAARIYLGRFKNDLKYNTVFNMLYSWYAAEGNGAPLQRFSEEYPDYPMKLALERDMDRAEAIDQLDLLAPYDENDYDYYRLQVRQLMGKKIALVALQRMLQPLLAERNYSDALTRAKQFEICFDNAAHDEYTELCEILAAPATDKQLTEVLSDSNLCITNAAINERDSLLYYTMEDSSSCRIGYAIHRDGGWQPAGALHFSNIENKALRIFGFFAEGKKMLIGSNGDIWIAEHENGNWRVTDIPPYPVNTDYVETDACMLLDGSGILLASDRPGGQNLQTSGSDFHGDTALATDLYFIPYTQSGWGEPVNLGANINTPYCERSPLLSRNLKTLYFITDGRGLGYGDVYVASRSNVEDWSAWSQPVNIGKELNSGHRELSVSFSPGEQEILMCSDAGGKPACLSFPTWHNTENNYRSYTLDVLGMEEYLFRVRVADIAQQAITQVSSYSGKSHSININLHKDKRYALLGDAGMFFIPAVMVGPGSSSAQRLKGYTFPVLVALDKAIPLEAVTFEPSSATLQPVAKLQIEHLAQFMKNNPTATAELVINVAGHDDALAYNLSIERGRAIRNYLGTFGIDGSRIAISAYGNVNLHAGGESSVAIQIREQHK